MSRAGKYPVEIPSTVKVELKSDYFKASGKLGNLEMKLTPFVKVEQNGNSIVVNPTSDEKMSRAMWGTTRRLIANLVQGVSVGFTKELELVGVGYKAALSGKKLVLNLGYSHEINYPVPEGIEIKCPKPTSVVIFGACKQLVGKVASEIRSYRKPEPYKGKGVKYAGEQILRKEGKKK
jgi:large subunit ribosomal protein L6